LLRGAALPAAVVAGLLALPRPPRVGRPLGALAVAAGVLAAYFALGLGPVRPEAAWHWLPWLAVAGAVAGGAPLPAAVRVVPWLGVAALAAWLLVPDTLFASEEWQDWRPRVYAVIAGGVAILGLAMPLARRAGRVGLLLWAAAAAVGAVVLFAANNALLAQFAGALAAALAGAAITRDPDAAAGAVAVAAALHPALLAVGWLNNFNDELPAWALAVAALAPLGLVAGELPLSARGRTAARAVGVLVPVAVAAGVAARALAASMAAMDG